MTRVSDTPPSDAAGDASQDVVGRLMRLRFAEGYPTLTVEQARNAITIAQVARDLDVPRRGLQIAIATAIQESKLINLTGGDPTPAACSSSGPRPAGGAAPRSPPRCSPRGRSSAEPSTPATSACSTSPAGRTCR